MSASEFTAPTLPDQPSIGDEPLDYFTRVYLIFCQGLFRQMPSGSWKWSDDEKLSEICITDQAPYPRDRLEQRPAIITMRGPAQFGNLSLDNMRTVDWKTGAKERTDLIACTMSLVCIAKLDTEAQKIAWLIMRHLRTFKSMLQKYGGFTKIGDEVSVGPPSPPTGSVYSGEADNEATMVTVQSPFFFQWTERSEPKDALVMRELDMFMGGQLAPPDTTGVRQETVLRRPTVRGMPVGNQMPSGQPLTGVTAKIE